MHRLRRTLVGASIAISGLAVAPHQASALVTHNCSLSAPRPDVQLCMDAPGYDEVHLTGVANWTLNTTGKIGLEITHDTPPVILDPNAEINLRYTDTNPAVYSAAVSISGGSFTMQPGSKITNYSTGGLPTTATQGKRRGVWMQGNGSEDPVQEDGTFTMNGASVITAGSAVWMAGAKTSGSQTVVVQGGSVLWGYQAVGAAPQYNERHDIAIVDSTLVGTFYTLSLEPDWDDHGYIKANIHDNSLYNNVNSDRLGYFVVSPGGPACNTPIFASGSGIHYNHGSGKAKIVNAQASVASANDFPVNLAC